MPRHPSPAGFTVVEVLVALTLLGVGVAAWVGTSAVALRLVGATERELAARAAAARVAGRLAVTQCESLADGESGGDRWSVTRLQNGVRLIRVEHQFLTGTTVRVTIAEVAVACR